MEVKCDYFPTATADEEEEEEDHAALWSSFAKLYILEWICFLVNILISRRDIPQIVIRSGCGGSVGGGNSAIDWNGGA